MGTRACIGYKMPSGKIAYVTCRFDGYLEHVGMLLAERYNDFDKVLELLLGGDIVSLREDLERTKYENPTIYEHPSDCKAKIANGIGDYLLNVEGDYKYLFDKGRWYLVEGRDDIDGISWVLLPLVA